MFDNSQPKSSPPNLPKPRPSSNNRKLAANINNCLNKSSNTASKPKNSQQTQQNNQYTEENIKNNMNNTNNLGNADNKNQIKPFCITTNKLSELDIYLNMYRPNKNKSNYAIRQKYGHETDEATSTHRRNVLVRGGEQIGRNNKSVENKSYIVKSEEQGVLFQDKNSQKAQKFQKFRHINYQHRSTNYQDPNKYHPRLRNHKLNDKNIQEIYSSTKTTINHYEEENIINNADNAMSQTQRNNGIRFGRVKKYFMKQSTTPVVGTNNESEEKNDEKLPYSKIRYMSYNRIASQKKNPPLTLTESKPQEASNFQRLNLSNLQDFIANKNTNDEIHPEQKNHKLISHSNQLISELLLPSHPQPINKLNFISYGESFKNKRNYNEDRFIAKSLKSPYSHTSASFGKAGQKNYRDYMLYGVFDGHGGSACSQFIQKNLATLLQNNKLLLTNPEKCLKDTLNKLEEQFLKNCEKRATLETSGSTATVCLFCDASGGAQENTQKIIIANIGDSRICALGPKKYGIKRLTTDHKPELVTERQRIIKNGGKLYKQQISSRKNSTFSVVNISSFQSQYQNSNIKIFSQTRILPGNLNVSRTIGDIEVKLKKYGGASGVVIAEPELSELTINIDTFHKDQQQFDVIILGSDGLYEGLTDQQIYSIYNSIRNSHISSEQVKDWKKNGQKFCQQLSKKLIKAAAQKSSDNITALVVKIQ